MTKEELATKVRSDKTIGAGTCSVIDECYSDDELWESFGPASGCTTVRAALAAARRAHRAWRAREREHEAEARSGGAGERW